MSRNVKWIVGIMLVSSSAVIAAITVDFTADSRFTDLDRLKIVESLILDFTIDDSGQVMLDASVGKINSKDVIKAVNRWDGVVGTVSEPSMFNSSFTFTGNAWRRNDAGSYVYNTISIDGYGRGFLGVNGQNGSAIDGASSPNRNHEMLVWTLTTATAGLEVEVVSFDWATKKSASKGSFMLFDNDTVKSWYGQPGAGSRQLNGYKIRNGEPLTFTIPEDGNSGVGLSGFELAVTLSSDVAETSSKLALQKPTPIGLLTN